MLLLTNSKALLQSSSVVHKGTRGGGGGGRKGRKLKRIELLSSKFGKPFREVCSLRLKEKAGLQIMTAFKKKLSGEPGLMLLFFPSTPPIFTEV